MSAEAALLVAVRGRHGRLVLRRGRAARAAVANGSADSSASARRPTLPEAEHVARSRSPCRPGASPGGDRAHCRPNRARSLFEARIVADAGDARWIEVDGQSHHEDGRFVRAGGTVRAAGSSPGARNLSRDLRVGASLPCARRPANLGMIAATVVDEMQAVHPARDDSPRAQRPPRRRVGRRSHRPGHREPRGQGPRGRLRPAGRRSASRAAGATCTC